MGPDDKICYCYHVPYRKLWSYARREKLQRPSQLSGCLGAGTGCGWCIPILKRIFEAAQSQQAQAPSIEMSAEEYAQSRKAYIQSQARKNSF
ncbi:MAG TPA: (2Fe-2S)-binding protein [Phycisphaerae bacterium]|jgi:NAD(P)H-nitrite reductase large subunit|nr:(2Fe-2S)-binding protein [Phycisphaerae bacterium]HOB74000.1 (2Fe-2S)-binding protein [Phycisphaerae bacterium]HOJ53869.1 (2Fe-2S)-binding protein [Phycisphaerae bacterium]HOL26200.1 (2Fe-2S)-binding protein [Phycisphaerae bacterium]HPP20187.1 (2Fe-2S)-binding protein [Phycisphaerae bacterium]